MVWRRRVTCARQAPSATPRPRRPARPQLLKPPPHEVLAAVRSLYADGVKPLGRIVRKRCGERAAAVAGLPPSAPPDVDPRYVRRVCEEAPELCVEVEEGGEWIALLRDRPPTFIDFYGTSDPYPADMWAQAAEYFSHCEAEDMVLPGGRYACAQELLERGLPFLAGRSLGEVCHIIQLSVSQRRVLGYRNGDTVPYRFSQSRAKEECAAEQKPSTSKHSEIPLADWEGARRCLREMLASAPGPRPGAITVSNVKRMFRTKFQLELSETALGHSKLTELLQDPKLCDVCSVQLQGRGYAVVERTGGDTRDDEQEVQTKAGSARRSVKCSPASSPPGSAGRKTGAASSSSRSPECFGSPSGSTGIESHDDFEPDDLPRQIKLHEHDVNAVPVAESEGTASHLSSLSNAGNDGPLGSMVSRTFIHFADPAPPLAVDGSRTRPRSVPKDFGSSKHSWEYEDHVPGASPRRFAFEEAGAICGTASTFPPIPSSAREGAGDDASYEWSAQYFAHGLQPWPVEAMSEYASPYVAWFGAPGWSMNGEAPPPCSWWTGVEDTSLQQSATHSSPSQHRIVGASDLHDGDLTPSQQRLLNLRSTGQATMRMLTADQPGEADRFTGDSWERKGAWSSQQAAGRRTRGRKQAAR